MIEGDFLGEIYFLDRETVVFGRSDDVDIILSDTEVSRRHAMIQKKDDNFVLTDLRSTNGTLLNGVTVVEERLSDGDKIQLGGITLKFCYQDDIDEEYHRQLRNMAIRDGLTRIYNKRFVMDTLNKEFNYSYRHNIALSIILFDIDYFKKLNDTYGHPAGDYALKRIASVIEKDIRGYDVFARYGGEEFIFLLRNSDLTAAVPFAERIRQLVEKTEFAYEGESFAVTISVGVAAFDEEHRYKSETELLAAADSCLYKAKNNGRNQVGSPG